MAKKGRPLECPVCGNGISVNPNYNTHRCRYCRRSMSVTVTRVKGKRRIELEELIEASGGFGLEVGR